MTRERHAHCQYLQTWNTLLSLFYCLIERTVTDLGSALKISLPFCTLTDIGFGATVFGASKVLTVSTFSAVRVSPTADLAVTPSRLASISTGWFGSMFVISNHKLPLVSLAAIASTRGKLMFSCV